MAQRFLWITTAAGAALIVLGALVGTAAIMVALAGLIGTSIVVRILFSMPSGALAGAAIGYGARLVHRTRRRSSDLRTLADAVLPSPPPEEFQ